MNKELKALKDLGDIVVWECGNKRDCVKDYIFYDIVEKALQRNEPVMVNDWGSSSPPCPSCPSLCIKFAKYCHNCGQALRWEE